MWTAKSKDGTRLLVARSADGGRRSRTPTPIAAQRGRRQSRMGVDRRRSPRSHRRPLARSSRDGAAGGASACITKDTTMRLAGAPKADGAVRAQSSKLYFATLDDASNARAVDRRRLLLLQDGGRKRTGWCDLRGLAARVSRQSSATSRSRRRAMAAARSRHAGARQQRPAGSSTAARKTGRRWRSAQATPFTSSGQHSSPTPVRRLNRRSRCFMRQAEAAGRSLRASAIATEGTPRHPQLTATAGGLVAAWDEQTASGSPRVVLARGSPARLEGRRASRARSSVGAPAQTPAIAGVVGGHRDRMGRGDGAVGDSRRTTLGGRAGFCPSCPSCPYFAVITKWPRRFCDQQLSLSSWQTGDSLPRLTTEMRRFGDAEARQVALHRFRPLVSQREVVFGAASLVGLPLHDDSSWSSTCSTTAHRARARFGHRRAARSGRSRRRRPTADATRSASRAIRG